MEMKKFTKIKAILMTLGVLFGALVLIGIVDNGVHHREMKRKPKNIKPDYINV